ncbi:hypothetical protein [Pseudomonas fluorescens]|uniref:Uncharacterized protein n=1 Tax=Pseudomonas fluorescens TaxID=294 RepID=A0A7Z3C0N9_PSEFL|nr:hypothetical protein [Pseudomonas fluorescens]QJP93135.1 hypothetical protein C6Y56_00520 [Pseudomonas fluorescens]
MKMPKRLIAGLGVLMISATPLLASADPRDDHDHGGLQQGHFDDRGGDIVLIAVGTGIVYEVLDGVLY